MKIRASIAALLMMGQVASAQYTLSTLISQTNNVDSMGRSSTIIRWFQTDTVQYDIFARSGGAPLDVTSASFPVWYVMDRQAGLVYIAKTGTIVDATNGHVRMHLGYAESNLPERMYESIVRLYSMTNGTNVEIRSLARGPVEVQWSADATNYTQAAGITASNLIFNITVSSSGSGTNADITAVIAGTLLTGGGVSGDVTVHLDTVSADARWINEGQASSISNAMIAPASVSSNKIIWSTMPFGLEDGDQVTTNASELSVGMLQDARLSTNVSLLGQQIDGGEIVDGSITSNDIDAATDAAYRFGGGGGIGATNFGDGLSGDGLTIPLAVTNAPRWGGLTVASTGAVAGYVFRWDGEKAYIGPDDAGTAAATNAIAAVGVSTQLVSPLNTLLLPSELIGSIVSLGGGTGLLMVKNGATFPVGTNGLVALGTNPRMTIGTTYVTEPQLIVRNTNSPNSSWDSNSGVIIQLNDTRGAGSQDGVAMYLFANNNGQTPSGCIAFNGHINGGWDRIYASSNVAAASVNAAGFGGTAVGSGTAGTEWIGIYYARSLVRGSSLQMYQSERPIGFDPPRTNIVINYGTNLNWSSLSVRGSADADDGYVIKIDPNTRSVRLGAGVTLWMGTNEVMVGSGTGTVNVTSTTPAGTRGL